MMEEEEESAPVFFIDFEAFRQDGEFRIKELCVIEINQPGDPLYYAFRLDQDEWQALTIEEQKTNMYASRHLHRLHWLEGVSRYCKTCVMYHLARKFPRWNEGMFYVLDSVCGPKIKFLKKEFPHLRLANYNGLTFKTLPEPPLNIACPFREHGIHCAFRKCHQLLTHFTSSF